MGDTALDRADFRAAMSRFASGVTVVTTRDGGQPAGFTASAFCSLSLNPPLVLVCLDKGADCFVAFEQAQTMAISILSHGQDPLAVRFATRGADKFGPGGLHDGQATGLPLVTGALAHVECRIQSRPDGGDHVILVGEVLSASAADIEPMLHYNRTFGHFAAG